MARDATIAADRGSRWGAAILFALGLAGGQARALEPAPMAPPLDETFGPSEVAPFILQADAETRSRAVHCLTEAVYYEAASEPRAGQEAVAQVVINRLKHPGFPKSVCGVVFEGSARTSGCQFTFTCDGSLARRAAPERWELAEQVATAALDGHVAAEVGSSTHYHAAWMTPYWSKSLVPTSRIGGHVFYRMPGRLGSAQALTGQYEGVEPSAPAVLIAAADRGAARPRPGALAPRPHAYGSSEFSVWGLRVATLSAVRGQVVVAGDAAPAESAPPARP